MASIQVNMENHGFFSEAALVVDVYNHLIKRIERAAISLGDFKTFQVDPGCYAVQMQMPTGETVTEQVCLDKESDSVEIIFKPNADSPHEQMAWGLITVDKNLYRDGRIISKQQLDGIWLRLWHRAHSDAEFNSIPWTIQIPTRANHFVHYNFRLDQGQYFLQIGGGKMAHRFIALPSSEDIWVLLTPVDQQEKGEDPVEVNVTTVNQEAETLLSYLDSGSIAQARVVEAKVAEKLLLTKMLDPIAATVGAYFLIKAGDLDKLHDWTDNLANWFEWLPDGAVIKAWHLLKESAGNTSEARDWLLEAERRGVPIYTEGVRLLYDGLMLYDSSAKGKDEEIHQARMRFQSYADATLWDKKTTTFFGSHPARPSLKLRRGLPRSNKNVVFLEQVNIRQLKWLGLIPRKKPLKNLSHVIRGITGVMIPPGEISLGGMLSNQDVLFETGINSTNELDQLTRIARGEEEALTLHQRQDTATHKTSEL